MATNDTEKELQELGKQLAALQKDVGQLSEDTGKVAKQASDTAKEATSAALEKLEAEAKKLMDGMQSAGAQAVKSGETAVHSIEDKIKERPLMSTATALGIGFVVGILLNRRR